MAQPRPELIVKSIIPMVTAGIIAIYSLVVAVLIANSLTDGLTLYRSFLQLCAGLNVELNGLALPLASSEMLGTAQQPRLFEGMILILLFGEVLGLYGLIGTLILSTKKSFFTTSHRIGCKDQPSSFQNEQPDTYTGSCPSVVGFVNVQCLSAHCLLPPPCPYCFVLWTSGPTHLPPGTLTSEDISF